jgi:uncharacterized membrane protein YgcG
LTQVKKYAIIPPNLTVIQKPITMKKLLIASIFFCACAQFAFAVSTSIDCSKLPQKTSPANAVNDFANIMDAPAKEKLETELRAYWDSTSISLCVITVPTLDGYDPFDYSLSLYNCWGVGDKSNRGALLMIAVNERKIELRTGYGIEFILPDAVCKRVIDGDITPSFKEGNYAAGIQNGMHSLMKTLGTMSWEDRIRGIEDKKQAEKIMRARSWEVFIDFISIAAILAVLFFLFWILRRSWERQKERRKIEDENQETLKEVELGKKLLAAAGKEFVSEPSWAQKEGKEHRDACFKSLLEAQSSAETSNKVLHSDMKEAGRHTKEGKSILEKAVNSFKKIDLALKKKIQGFSEEAPTKYGLALASLKNIQTEIAGYVKNGFLFNNRGAEIDLLFSTLLARGKDLSNKEYHKDIYEYSGLSMEKADVLIKTVRDTVRERQTVDNMLQGMITNCEKLFSQKSVYEKVLNDLKSKYPKTVWLELDKLFGDFVKKLNPDSLKQAADEVKKNNSFEVQQFEKAYAGYTSLCVLNDQVTALFKGISDEKQNQLKAEKDFPDVLKRVEEKVAGATKAIKDGDVESKAKELAKNAAQKLNQAKLESNGALVNWLILMKLLSDTETDATNATKQAKDDIDEAARSRRRKAEEEAAASRRRSEESTRSYSTFSSSGYESGGGGGFGGFDGGSSGGGGAGGSW